eukprot:CAMPEP_0195634246 /NCGR_PEP_ID=MMETSP0815-20121206/22597_1 /TAXON_ID=97485 /ORGANISM="Prymnesium parvum, Strain Texoma1" /LENGTH=75 /DNA_ID=CAMNT_0040776003 /DNA_START=325 /DNA_END=550 /DNA_ORIENTATION=+
MTGQRKQSPRLARRSGRVGDTDEHSVSPAVEGFLDDNSHECLPDTNTGSPNATLVPPAFRVQVVRSELTSIREWS